jgi:hypothetical protein
VITVSTTSEAEAKEAAGVLSGKLAGLPPDRDYRVLLNGTEYTSRDEANRDKRRDRMREMIREAGPAGTEAPALYLRLYREGLAIPRATLYRWLGVDRDAGLIRRVPGAWAWCGKVPR